MIEAPPKLETAPNAAPPAIEQPRASFPSLGSRLGPQRQLDRQPADAHAAEAFNAHSRRSFLAFLAAAATGTALFRKLLHSSLIGNLRTPLRHALDFNAHLSRALGSDTVLARTYPPNQAGELRITGRYGIREPLVPETYRLQLVGIANPTRFPQYNPDVNSWRYRYKERPAADSVPADKTDFKRSSTSQDLQVSRNSPGPNTPGLLLTLSDLLRFPIRDLVTEFRCIEGWSEIVHWRGIRLADLLAAYPPALTSDGTLPRYIYMETPNREFFCGFDLQACIHPQTLLVTEMSGSPLTPEHGAPIRLHMPIKYGYKQIKCIGLIAYTDTKPDDYWAELGYDWHAGL